MKSRAASRKNSTVRGGEHELLHAGKLTVPISMNRLNMPHQQVPAHVGVQGWPRQTHGQHHQQEHQAPPEGAVGDEAVTLKVLPRLYPMMPAMIWGQTAIAQTHGQDHGADGEETCVRMFSRMVVIQLKPIRPRGQGWPIFRSRGVLQQ